MTAQDITQRLLDTAGVEWDGDRDYLGMSRLWMCPRKLFFEMKEGQPEPNAAATLRCHEGYLHERDVLSRLKSAGIHLRDEGKEIRGIRSRVKGHLDAIITIDRPRATPQLAILEIKSLLLFQEPLAPRHKDIQQVQAYMHFLAAIPRSILVYKSRTSGEIEAFTIPYDPETGSQLERKARSILQAIDDDHPPNCECRRCPNDVS